MDNLIFIIFLLENLMVLFIRFVNICLNLSLLNIKLLLRFLLIWSWSINFLCFVWFENMLINVYRFLLMLWGLIVNVSLFVLIFEKLSRLLISWSSILDVLMIFLVRFFVCMFVVWFVNDCLKLIMVFKGVWILWLILEINLDFNWLFNFVFFFVVK